MRSSSINWGSDAVLEPVELLRAHCCRPQSVATQGVRAQNHARSIPSLPGFPAVL
jgi:hypothetical protein